MCVDGLGYVYVCESFVILDQCEKPPSLFVLTVCTYGGVVAYFWCFSFLCESCFLYGDDVRLGAVYDFFLFRDFVSDAVHVDLKYADVLVLWLIVSGWAVICLWWAVVLLLRCMWVYEWCTQSGLYYRCFICVHFR